MSEQPTNDVNFSFLSPIPAQLQPYLFELTPIFAGKTFLKWIYVEAYELQNTHIAELVNNDWQKIQSDDLEQSVQLLIASSQIAYTIADLNARETAALYMRAHDLTWARQYPVLLVSEKKPEDDMLSASIGAQAILFDGPHAMYVYNHKQLPPEAKEHWKQLQDVIQTVSYVETLDPLHIEKPPRSKVREQIQTLSDLAKELAKAYCELHQAKPGKRHTVPKSLSLKQQGILANASRIPESHALEAALLAMSNAVEGAHGWKKHRKLGPVFTHNRLNTGSSAAVSIQETSEQLTAKKDITKQLWTQVNNYSDLDGDVLLAMLAQVTLRGTDAQGAVWITAEDILHYRGITPKKHVTAENTMRDAGHRPEDIRSIAACVERLRSTHVSVSTLRQPRKPGGRTRTLRLESFLLLIRDFIVPDEIRSSDSTLADAIAWRYVPGESLEIPMSGQIQKRAAWLLQKALEYDPYHERWEKRLSRYCMFHLRIGSSIFGGTTIHRTIETLLTENSLTINTTDPGKTMARFEQALATLERDGHISSWNEQDYRAYVQTLPARQWLPLWLSYELEISAAPLRETLSSGIDEI